MAITRKEQYLAYMNGEDVTIPEPVTRVEQYLNNLCLKGGTDPEAIATATQEQVNMACSDWLDEHGATMTKDANGYVKLGGTANGN